MIGQSLWKNLKSLVNLDKQIKELNSKISVAEKIIEQDLKIIPEIHLLLEKNQKEYLTAKKNVTQQELTAKELRETEAVKKELLDKITNQKEQKAAEKEYKIALQKRIEQDDLLMKTWHQLEEKEKQIEKEKAEKEENVKKLQEGINAQRMLVEDLHIKKNDLDQERLDAIKNIPKEWLEKYESMRHRVQDPIVPVIDNACSACYYTVLRQDLNQLKKAGVLPCRNCYRFLYYDEEEQKDLKKATY